MSSSLQTENLIFGDQLDSLIGFVNTQTIDPLSDLFGTINYFDLTASVILHNDLYMFGLSVKHLNQPNTSFNKESPNKIPMDISVLSGYEFELNPFERNFLPLNSYLFAFGILDFKQKYVNIYLSQDVQFGPISFGLNQKLSTRNGFSFNNFGLSTGISIETFDFGLFYQLPTRNGKINSPSIFELQVTFNFSKYLRNNRRLFKRLQTVNYF